MEQTVAGNPEVAALRVALFHARFDPAATGGRERAESLQQRIVEALDEVANLDEDRILRSFLSAITATVRTNFYQRTATGGRKADLSFQYRSEEGRVGK